MNILVNPVAGTNQSNSILMTQAPHPSHQDASYASVSTLSTSFVIPTSIGVTGNRQPCHLNSMNLVRKSSDSAAALPIAAGRYDLLPEQPYRLVYLLVEWASRVGAAQPQQEVFGAHGLAVILLLSSDSVPLIEKRKWHPG